MTEKQKLKHCADCRKAVEGDPIVMTSAFPLSAPRVLCVDCWHKRYAICAECKRIRPRTAVTKVKTVDGEARELCGTCSRQMYRQCRFCGLYEHIGRVDNYGLCRQCHLNQDEILTNYMRCNGCHRFCRYEDLRYFNYLWYCPSCYGECVKEVATCQ